MISDLSVAMYAAGFVLATGYALLAAIGYLPRYRQGEIVASYLMLALILASRAVLVERSDLYWETVYFARAVWTVVILLHAVILVRHLRTVMHRD